MPQRRNLNPARIDPTGTIPVAQRRRYPQYRGHPAYLQRGLDELQRTDRESGEAIRNRAYLLGSYTWQKNLDLGATDDFSTIHSEFKKWDKGRSTFDVPHRFVASYVYELPFGKGKHFCRLGPSGRSAVGGWQINGITTFASGSVSDPRPRFGLDPHRKLDRSIPNVDRRLHGGSHVPRTRI